MKGGLIQRVGPGEPPPLQGRAALGMGSYYSHSLGWGFFVGGLGFRVWGLGSREV